AGDLRLTDEQLAWKARAALRRGNWQVVRDSIDQMSAGARQERAWSYWYGRALAAQGEETGSRAYYLRVAGRPDFYGLLAEEELGYMVALPDKIYVPGEDEVAAAKRDPGIARALELIRLGLRTEGVREWIHTIRFFDDAKLIAAAEVAHRAEIYDRVIETANKTVRVHNFALRYPVPYQDVFQEYAKTHGVDPALVLGLVRQESRFLQESRSSAGATGLMQLMPRTARYVAAKLGLRNYLPHHREAGLARGGIKVGVPSRRRERAKPLIQLPTVEVLEADVTAPGVLQRLAAGRAAVINLIGILHSRRGRRDERGPHDYGPDFARLHVELPQAVVAACRAVGVKRLLHMSALGAAPQAPSEYLRSKAIGEQAVLAADDLEVTAFR